MTPRTAASIVVSLLAAVAVHTATTTAACEVTLPVYEAGRRAGRVCARDVRTRGLTIVNLSDDWTPRVLSDAPARDQTDETEPAGAQPYRPIFVALADERLADVPAEYLPERYLELFGVPPTLRVLRERLADDARHECHGQIDDAALLDLDRLVRPRGEDLERQQRRVRELAMLNRRLSRAAERRGLASIDELAGDARFDRLLLRRAGVSEHVEAIRALQAHLRCDGLLTGRYGEGVFDPATAAATELYHRRHAVFSGPLLTSGTRGAIALGSREADFHALLRTLRERVASATGLIEDGSAGHTWGTVLGRTIDAAPLRAGAGQSPAPNPAGDLLSPATEAAARALGLVDPAGALSALASLARARVRRVAIRLPTMPRYHAGRMELRAEIDRGDVRYESPIAEDGRRRPMHVARRAVLTLFARDAGDWKALVRWPTTIGGWNDEQVDAGASELRYKESPVGPRIWRQIVASPSWIPPPATPDADLVRRTRRGIVPRHDVLGPGYRSAFGLAMLVHERRLGPDGGDASLTGDEGIRTHGSVAYRSILRGTSHGCHRLHNGRALRLASFVLAHREHVRVGVIPVRYSRDLQVGEHTATVEMTSRGYGFELVDPVPVRVLRGRIIGRQRTPITFPPEVRAHSVE
ncbi:MAG: hypothetical protein JRH11_07705 [Deltaproteobacteria bacterium]|nr:hypothetical protein [Deltaproteobacteria bacterium]